MTEQGKRACRFRVAHVGCGAWGSNLVRELSAHPKVDLAVVVDPDPKAWEVAKRYAPGVRTSSTMQEVNKEQFDGVVIASPGPLHAEHIRAALDMGAHIFVEKPMTTAATDARALLAQCQACGRIGMVGHLLHHHGAVRSMLALIQKGRIGRLQAFQSSRFCRRSSRDADGSLLWSLAPHDMSVLRALDSSPVRWMKVELRRLGNEVSPNLADLQLELREGLHAHIVVSRAHETKVRRMEVVGEDAALVFDDVLASNKLRLRWSGGEEVIAYDDEPPLRVEVDAFVRCMQTGARPEISFLEGLEVVELLEQAHAVSVQTCERPLVSVVR